MSIEKKVFGKVRNEETVYLYKLQNKHGAYIEVTDFGAILVKVCVPDRKGQLKDVVLGYDEVSAYETNGCYFGSTIGRSGNRICNGRFTLNGKEYQLPQNENGNNLHSGPDGYQKKIWEVRDVNEGENSVTFGRISPDGEQGYPGTFNIEVRYTFTNSNQLRIDYHGVCDSDTVANMTNHTYFNLSGADGGSILDNRLAIYADAYTPVIDSASIPTGEIASVEGTPMDFRVEKPIGQDIEADFQQLRFGSGFDHNYMTRDYQKGTVRKIARAWAEDTGIVMNVYSDLPAVQFYAGNFIENEKGKDGVVYGKRSGFCLETQYAPNAVNEENFEAPILRASSTYRTTTIYEFCVAEA